MSTNVVKKLNPQMPIPKLDNVTLGDYWSWAYSNLLNNINRGIFAEFLVGVALSVTDQPRKEWESWDLEYRDQRIEVKTSAYLQSWLQSRSSIIRFDIGHKNGGDIGSSTLVGERRRFSDWYIFCLYSETDPSQADVLNIAAWQFFILSTTAINQSFGEQKGVALNRIKALCSALTFEELKPELDKLILKPELLKNELRNVDTDTE